MERKLKVLFLGRLTKKSNINILIKAFNSNQLKDVELNFIGKIDYGLDFVSNYKTKNIIFHGEIINEEEISRIANECRIFVYGGSVGLSLIHAMNYGLPLIYYIIKL